MQLFDSQTIQEKTGDNFHVHTRLNLIGFLAEQDSSEDETLKNYESHHETVHVQASARKGFLNGLMECGSCRQTFHWQSEQNIYQAEHHAECTHKIPLQGFQVESMVGSELRKLIMPANVAATLRYQEQLRVRAQTESNRLQSELNLLRQQINRNFRFRSNSHLISAHQQQLQAALEKANSRRIAYLESTLARWETNPGLLDESDALAICLLARDFEQIWSDGNRAVRRRILHELVREIQVFHGYANPELNFNWKVTGLEHRGMIDSRAIS